MPNNFRVTGNRYISKDGNDADTGLTPDDPKATLTDNALANAVVGAGVYKGAFSLTNASSTEFRSDGTLIINCTGNLLFGNTGANGYSKSFVANYGYIFVNLNGFSWLNQIRAGSNIAKGNLTDTIMQNGSITWGAVSNNNLRIENCVLESITSTLRNIGFAGDDLVIAKSQLFNSSLNASTGDGKIQINNSFIDANTIITVNTIGQISASFTNNNFRGRMRVAGVLYELKKDKAGNAIDPNPSYLDIIAVIPSVYTNGNFSQDPEFLNIEKRDYWSVAVTSPNLFIPTGGNIGATSFAAAIKATDPAFTGGTLTDVVLSSNDLVLDFPAVIGSGKSTAVQLAPIAQVLINSKVAALFAFNSDIAAGDPENYNVIANENYTPLTAGANPRRLTYKMRWTSNADAPTIDAEWDNQGYTAAGDFVEFEHYTTPLIDVVGIGNGDPLFNMIGAVGIFAKYVQIEQTLQNGLG